MTQINRFEYSGDKKITAQIADEIDDFLWISFAQNSDGNCIIEKEAKFTPIQTYYSLERAVTEVNAMDLDSSNLYVAYNDSSLLGEIISKTNPITSTIDISIPIGINEPSIDVKIDGSDLWFLIPGDISGENAKLLKYNTSGVLQQTVDLIKTGLTIINAKSMAIDSNNNIWIATYTNPATIVRVFEISGGLYDFTETQII
jgi:hypothetical protein